MENNKIDISLFENEKKQSIYKYLWENKIFNFPIIKTGKKDISYEFEFAGKDLISFIGESIANNFGISKKEDKDLFLKKFRMACSGTGDEIRKITTLHSSSLCALLFFFSINKNKPLKNLPGLENYEFTDSLFEFKNKVIGYPSNIDVILLGERTTGQTKEKVILFLESKFSEYITGVESKYDIGISYFKDGCFSKPIYDELISKGYLNYNEKDSTFLSEDKPKYFEGIKQIVSHYYGIRNFISKKYYKKDNENLDLIKKYGAKEFILGEILFDNFGDTLKENFLKPYEGEYEKLAKVINAQCKKEDIFNFRILDNSLRYSKLKNIINDFPIIEDFYFPE